MISFIPLFYNGAIGEKGSISKKGAITKKEAIAKNGAKNKIICFPSKTVLLVFVEKLLFSKRYEVANFS